MTAVRHCPVLLPKKGHPHRAQRPDQRGKAQEHGGGGMSTPSEAPGQGKKGIIKRQKTTKLNTKVGTAGKGRGVG